MEPRSLQRRRKTSNSKESSRDRSKLKGGDSKSKQSKHNPKQSISQKKKRCRDAAQAIYNQYFVKNDPKAAKQKKKPKIDSKRLTKHTDCFFGNDEYLLAQHTNQNFDQSRLEIKPFQASNTSHKRERSLKNVQTIMNKLVNAPTIKKLSGTQRSINTNPTFYDKDILANTFELSCNPAKDDYNESTHSKCNQSTYNQSYFIEQPKELECRQAYNQHTTDLNNPQKDQAEFIRNMLSDQKEIDPKILRNQKDITMRMRSQTIDWMFSLSEQIQLKRKTFHLAVVFMDTYLSLKHTLKSELQLVAIVSIILAFKFEQKAPMNFINIFVSGGSRGYSRSRILEMEKKVALELKYRFHKTTLISWVHILIYEWDRYICQGSILSMNIVQENMQLINTNLTLNNKEVHSLIAIKFLQIIDAAMFIPEIYLFDKGKIVFSAFYLILRIEIETIISGDNLTYRAYYEKYKKGTNPIFFDKYGFNELFSEFLIPYGLELTDLIPTNKFMSQFLDIDFSKSTDFDEINPEQYLYSQTYNKDLLFYINTKI